MSSPNIKLQTRVPFVCRTSYSTVPNIQPIIINVSRDKSLAGVYSVVYIYGSNFSIDNHTMGTSVVQFAGNELSVSFYSSHEISFVVPSNAAPGHYSISVLNINSLIPISSNSVNYTIL